MSSQQIRVGSVVIIREGRRFLLHDAHNRWKAIAIDDADVPEVIRFFNEASEENRASGLEELQLPDAQPKTTNRE